MPNRDTQHLLWTSPIGLRMKILETEKIGGTKGVQIRGIEGISKEINFFLTKIGEIFEEIIFPREETKGDEVFKTRKIVFQGKALMGKIFPRTETRISEIEISKINE